MSNLTEGSRREFRKAYLSICGRVTIPCCSPKLCPPYASAFEPSWCRQPWLHFIFSARVVEFSDTKYLLLKSQTSAYNSALFSAHLKY